MRLMKQIISSPDKHPDNQENKEHLEKIRNKSGCDRVPKLIFLYQYYLSQFSSRQLFRLITFRTIPAISIPIICVFGLSATSNQTLSNQTLIKNLNSTKLYINKASTNKSNVVHKSEITTIKTSKKSLIEHHHVWNTNLKADIGNIKLKLSQGDIVYNVTKPPKLNTDDKKLDDIVSELVTLAKEQDLPKESLSITLIDVNRHKIAGYQQNIPRYPASVIKLFWMVALQEQIQQGLIINDSKMNADLKAMILKSDNDAASRIVDVITQTNSFTHELEFSKFKNWKNKRNQVSKFFKKSGYKNINISQKTFPINEPNMKKPEGTELQLINNSNESSISNQITTDHAARLMYEIATKQAVSPKSSQQMLDLLKRDLHLQAWKNNPPISDEFNPIENFLGESLPPDKIYFASKAGQNSTVRHEVAYVVTKDRKTQYIIAIFGKDSAYSESNTIFPDMSKLVYEKMTNTKIQN